ncbi:VOC family protein [Plastoroseomonas arctica]|uniref:VOC family protein n=1 Tax=Plastoroseomonas arctica TaxID=1509237 RepID=A0AAF1JX08_9PROT|nr:VOC family protein [Plastoroseomonas arctica]MBR0655217.1 VOC family protein [Plastoroseomonas arctica]
MASPFIWYELLTDDVDAAGRFYGEVVGWTVQPSGQPGMDYRFWKAGENAVGGLMATPPGKDGPGMKPGWLGYVRVADVDATIARMTSMGGAEVMPAVTLPGVGRMALVADPQGAVLYVMAPEGEMPPGAVPPFARGQVGHGGWNELHSTDWKSAFEFYRTNFGWTEDQALDMGPMGTYQLVRDEGENEAMGAMFNNPSLPRPAWLYYFHVDSIAAAKTRLETAGGSVLMGPHEVPGGQWIIQARDPQGAMFALVGPQG